MELIAGAIIYSVIVITLAVMTAYCLKKDWPLLAVLFGLTLVTVSCNLKINNHETKNPTIEVTE